ncbi:MAG: hypothetical protein E7169_01645 [Firmicutes bacterium]|nr:hypothetical protein [Bacillota bacterium]
MKKMNNRGFMLSETLIVATFLVTTLLFLYIQFNKVTKTYDTSFKYNTVNGLYSTNNIIDYIKTDGLENLKIELLKEGIEFVDITSCHTDYFKEKDYCSVLIESLNIKTVIFTNENLTTLKSINTGLKQTIIDFIDYIKFEETDGYRVIVEFNDDTFASLKVKE